MSLFGISDDDLGLVGGSVRRKIQIGRYLVHTDLILRMLNSLGLFACLLMTANNSY